MQIKNMINVNVFGISSAQVDMPKSRLFDDSRENFQFRVQE